LLEPAGPAQPPAETHLKQAQTHLDIALAKLREAGDQSFIPRALLPRAWLHALQGEWQAAQNRLDEAYSIATRGGPGGTMRLHLADIHLHRARLFGVADAKPVGAVVNRDGAAHGTQANPASASNRSRLETAPTPRPPAYPWASPAADLAEARRLIERCGYGRRLAELADAELALLGVRATLNEPKG
jgi:hypothetical protein